MFSSGVPVSARRWRARISRIRFETAARRVLHRLRLVQHRDFIVVPEQQFMVPVEQRIGRDDQVMVGDFREAPPPVGPVQHQNLQVGHEARGLAPPVADQARRHHQQARKGRLLLQVPVRQQREGLHGLAEPHVVGQQAAEAAIRERPQPAVAGALVGPQSSLQRSGRRQFRRLGKRPEPGSEIEYLPPAGPGRAAAFQSLRQLEQAARIGPMEFEQPLRFQKRFGEAPEARSVQCEPGAVVEPHVEKPAGQVALDIEPFLKPAPFVDRQLRHQLEHDRRDIERPAVRFQRQAE